MIDYDFLLAISIYLLVASASWGTAVESCKLIALRRARRGLTVTLADGKEYYLVPKGKIKLAS